MLDRIEKINVEDFEKRYPFNNTIQISRENFQKMLEMKALNYVWLPACPRANRITAVFKWYNLDEFMTEHPLNPYYQMDNNWIFSAEDEFFHANSIQDYFPANIKATQPFLYNKNERRVVSNHTYQMSLLIASVMDEIKNVPSEDSLFPKNHRPMLEKWNAWLYEEVNAKIYQVASMRGNEKAIGCAQLERTYQLLDEYLENKDYLYAEQLTETDLRLFNNLVRHELYFKQFKVFQKPLNTFKYLERYVKRILENHPYLLNDLYFKEIRATHFRSEHNIKKYGYMDEVPSLQTLFPFVKF